LLRLKRVIEKLKGHHTPDKPSFNVFQFLNIKKSYIINNIYVYCFQN